MRTLSRPAAQAEQTVPLPRPTGDRRPHRTWILVAIAVTSAVFIGLAYSYITLLITGGLSDRQSDFLAYYAAGHMVLHGQSALYDIHTLSGVEASIVAPRRLSDGGLPFL